MMKWEAEEKGYSCNDCFLSMQNCHDKSICCEDETGLCDLFEEMDGESEEKNMLMLTLEDAVKVAKELVDYRVDDEEIIRRELEQKCWIPPEKGEAAKRLNDLIFDINPAEICSQIESDNLTNWCKTMQVEMKMAMVQLPCWSGKE